MAMSSADEKEFLRDQVQRHEATLAQYQQRYKPIKTSDERAPNIDAPWLKHEVLSPLLREYDDSIYEVEQLNHRLQSDFTALKRKTDQLVEENERLRSEMKSALENAVRDADIQQEPERVRVGVGDEDTEELKMQLERALQEKERQKELCDDALAKVDRLELALDRLQTNPQWRQTAEIKAEYQLAVDQLTQEVSELQDELRRSKTEHRTAEVQVSDLRQTLDEVREQLLLKEKAHREAVGEGVLYQEECEQNKRKVDDHETKIFTLESELERLRAENASLSETCKELQAKCVDLEQKEYEASLQVRDSVQLVENAVLERDQVRIREQQMVDENRKLQDAINKLLDEAGSRTREEVESVKQLCNANLERLAEELYQMELDNSEKLAQIERLVRDKKSLEAEIEKCYNEGLSRGTKDQHNLAELTRRACQAETEREDALIRLENVNNHLKRVEISRTQEKQQLQTEVTQLKDRLSHVTSDLDRVSQDRLQTQDEVDSLKRQLQNLNKEKEAGDRRFVREFAALEQTHSLKEQEFTVKLQSLEDSHRQSLLEVRRHLNAQQKMAAKWKVECESITEQFEKKLGDVRAELSRVKHRNQELVNLLSESQKKTAEAKLLVSEYTRNMKMMEDRVRETEVRASHFRQVNMPRPRRERRPYSPAESEGPPTITNPSPVHLYAVDDILNGAGR